MRNTIIFGLLVTLFGFTVAAAQASDWRESGHRDGRQVSGEASTDSAGRRDRNERSDRGRGRHDEAAEHRQSRERHDESRERHHRR